jgi:hypothetical protein
MNILDVFQKGLHLGSARLPFDPSKRYAYVEHPTEGWRVYLRSAVFLHSSDKPFIPKQFLVVKKAGSYRTSATWEPPKGQMEGKDIRGKSVLNLLKENALRETAEESHITHIQKLIHTGLVFQSQESDYPDNHFFQYHIFQGFVTDDTIQESFDTFAWAKEHPKAVARWTHDRKEKDAIAWFSPKETRLNPRWTPDIVALYLRRGNVNTILSV